VEVQDFWRLRGPVGYERAVGPRSIVENTKNAKKAPQTTLSSANAPTRARSRQPRARATVLQHVLGDLTWRLISRVPFSGPVFGRRRAATGASASLGTCAHADAACPLAAHSAACRRRGFTRRVVLRRSGARARHALRAGPQRPPVNSARLVYTSATLLSAGLALRCERAAYGRFEGALSGRRLRHLRGMSPPVFRLVVKTRAR
jgi:hypothetical protein